MAYELYECLHRRFCGHTSYDLSKPNPWVKDIILKSTPPSGRVIDLGCGLGRHLGALYNLGIEIYGLDWLDQRIKHSRQTSNSDLILADMASLPFQDESFDTALAWRSIYFQKVEKIKHTIEEIKRVLKPGGTLICSCRSKTNTLYFVAQQMGEEIEPDTFRLDDGIDFIDACYHFFSSEEIEEVFSGFRIESLTELQLRHTRYTASHPELQNNFWVFTARK
ncbi:MAG: class I SAM-dependent methyltransferase [Thermodesulfobacteriota bacterium]|nr:class I SAM-dependent methyltransferase [Thermodesulfobacteriota bacterium]